MMRKMSNENALAHLDDLMSGVSMSKEAADALEDAAANGVIPGNPAGTEKIPVTVDNSPENKEEIKNPAEGEFDAEKHQNLKDSTGGVSVEDMAANSNGNAEPVATDFNAGSIDKKSGEQTMTQVQKKGDAINALLDKRAAEAEGMPKLSAEEQEQALLFKKAADSHYVDYCNSFAAGMLKRAEDMAAVQEARGVSEEEAAEVLDELATENPELIIPEEGEEGAIDELAAEDAGLADLSPEDAAMLEELASELEAQGVTPEELAALAAEVDEEDAVEKVAADRNETLKGLIRNLRG